MFFGFYPVLSTYFMRYGIKNYVNQQGRGAKNHLTKSQELFVCIIFRCFSTAILCNYKVFTVSVVMETVL